MQKNNTLDVQKVFDAIALIITRRGEGDVRVLSIKNIQKKAETMGRKSA